MKRIHKESQYDREAGIRVMQANKEYGSDIPEADRIYCSDHRICRVRGIN